MARMQRAAFDRRAQHLARLSYAAVRVGAYFLAIHEDRECLARSGLSRSSIEECLFWYIRSECVPSERIKGFDYNAGACVKYEVAGIEPIHALFDTNGNLIERISAYE